MEGVGLEVEVTERARGLLSRERCSRERCSRITLVWHCVCNQLDLGGAEGGCTLSS